jgi:hypothetical protein
MRSRKEKPVTKPFSLSGSGVKDYNLGNKETIVADRFIPIRRNNKTTLAFSDVMDDEALKENFSVDSPGMDNGSFNRNHSDKEESQSNTLNNY